MVVVVVVVGVVAVVAAVFIVADAVAANAVFFAVVVVAAVQGESGAVVVRNLHSSFCGFFVPSLLRTFTAYFTIILQFTCDGGADCPCGQGAVVNSGANRLCCFGCDYNLCRTCCQARQQQQQVLAQEAPPPPYSTAEVPA